MEGWPWLIEDENKEKAKTLLIKNGFNIVHKTSDFLQFSGIGLKIQAFSNDLSREYQDKADIQFLMENYSTLDWNKIKIYADLFNKWSEIEEIKNKINI